jgi:hypothetical protein
MDDGINYVTALATQWVNRENQGFAALAVELIPETAPKALITALASGGAGDAYRPELPRPLTSSERMETVI